MDVFKPFLQRLSQPILLSFCIAWIFWNWEIVVALCWYDAKTIEKLGYKNHIEYIGTMKDHWRNYFLPLIIALLYPLSILILNNFHTFFKMLEEKLFTRIVKNATVPTGLYLNAQDQIEIKEKRISKFIALETKMEGEINDLTIKNKDLTSKLSSLTIEYNETNSVKSSLEESLHAVDQKLNYLTNKSSIKFLEGTYELELLERTNNGNKLHSLISTKLKIVKHSNEDKYFIFLNFGKSEIKSEIIEYYYNILTDLIVIRTKIIEYDTELLNQSEQNKFEIIKMELMDALVALPQTSMEKVRFTKNIMFKNSNIRFDLEKWDK